MSNTDNLRELIFKPDGTVRGLYYRVPSTRRGAVLTINLGNRKKPPFLRTSMIVDGRDFNEVYQNAVAKVAEWYSVTDAVMLTDLFTSGTRFLATNNLVLREVRYQQIQPVQG